MDSKGIIDWELMVGGFAPYSRKNIVLYGASSSGRKMFHYLEELGLNNWVIAFCDSNSSKWRDGAEFCGKSVITPEQLMQLNGEVIIVISSIYLIEISRELIKKGEGKLTIASAFAIRYGIHLDIYDSMPNPDYLSQSCIENYKSKYELWKSVKREYIRSMWEYNRKETNWLLYSSKNPILIHSREKTGNNTLVNSLDGLPNIYWTKHYFYPGKAEDFADIKAILRDKSLKGEKVKVLCGVREPVSLAISQAWQHIDVPYGFGDRYLTDNFPFVFGEGLDEEATLSDKGIYWWYDEQIRKAFDIDLFDPAWNMQKRLVKGYTLLEKDNIEIFLYKMEVLSDLGKEISDFVGVQNVSFERKNQAKDKKYALAYLKFKENCKIPEKWMEQHLKLMENFYTNEECENVKRMYK